MKQSVTKVFSMALLGLLALHLSACAKMQSPETAASESYTVSAEIADPIEPLNRAVFSFNNALDMFLIEPAAKGYNAIFPTFVRDGIQNFMRNLKSPLIIGNNLLQGEVGDAGVATARFVINSTAGIAGLVDVASAQGLTYESEDFGQTLGKWGVGDGFYLVLPVIGPSSLRDGVGMGVDAFADPVRIVAFDADNEWIYYTRNIVEGFDNRARLVNAVEDLRRNSLDFYATIRSAYSQKRQALIRDENPDASPDIPHYDE